MGLRLRAQSKANQRAHRVFGLTVELEVSALRNLWIWLATVVLATTVSWSASTIVGWDFEQGMGQWQSPDPLTKITLAVGPKEANSGSSALYVKFPRIQKPDEMQTRQMPGAVMMQLPAASNPAKVVDGRLSQSAIAAARSPAAPAIAITPSRMVCFM